MTSTVNVRAILTFVIAIIVALWLGVSIVTEQTGTILKVGGASLLLLCAILGKRMWLLMFFFMALDIPLLRGFSTAQLGMGLFLGFGTLMFFMHRLPVRFVFGELEFWRLAVALCVMSAHHVESWRSRGELAARQVPCNRPLVVRVGRRTIPASRAPFDRMPFHQTSDAPDGAQNVATCSART